MKYTSAIAILLCLLLNITHFTASAQGKYYLVNSNVNFYSKAPLEDIKAETSETRGVIDFSGGAFAFKIPVKSFQFNKQLMQVHFNENYMESHKYPYATFKGKLEGDYNLRVNGSYKVSAVGEINIHGITQNRSIPCLILVKNGVYSIHSEFKVKLVDHKIEVPTIVYNKIAEVIEVTITSELTALN